MKKYIFIILGCVVIVLIALGFMSSGGKLDQAPGSTDGQPADQASQQEARKPEDIKVAIYDPADEPSALTKLLESRLKSIGYQVSITKILPDSAEAQSNLTTLLLHSSMQSSMTTLQHTFLHSSLVRQILNESFAEDVLIAVWNVEDISWGDQADEAHRLALPEPASVSIVTYNAGAASGAAGAFVDVLKAQGYTQAQAENTDTVLKGASIIYYKQGYKESAKKMMELLKAQGYSDRTYRARQDQPAALVIMLAPPSNTATATSTAQ